MSATNFCSALKGLSELKTLGSLNSIFLKKKKSGVEGGGGGGQLL